MKNLIFVFVLALLINNNLVGQTIYKSRYEYRDSLGKMVYRPNNILFIFDLYINDCAKYNAFKVFVLNCFPKYEAPSSKSLLLIIFSKPRT